MSRETQTWLEQNILIGFTEKRGNAWWYRGQGDNHYPGAVPAEAVRERLFNWHAVEGSIETVYLDEERGGVTRIVDETRKAIIRPDTQTVLGVFKQGFQIHDYDEWLMVQSGRIAGTDLGIASAGLLRGGALAWVQFELPETMQCEGIGFRPFFTSATSLDGSLKTTWNTGINAVECDNTLDLALAEKTWMHAVKHTKNSKAVLADIRADLGIQIATVAEDYMAELEALVHLPLSPKAWDAFLDEVVPLPKPEEQKSSRALTMATKKRDELNTLYRSDSRAAQWAGTGYGALAALNTWQHHFTKVRGNRAERNAFNMVVGNDGPRDAKTLAALRKAVTLTA